MKYAKALALGGELIDAVECNSYEDYYHLSFVCPECGEKVYYCKEYSSSRSRTGKVSPSFKHHALKDVALIERCKLRVNNYSQPELDRRKVQSRNQRLKIYQTYFWRLFCSGSIVFRDWSYEKIDDFFEEIDRKQIPELSEWKFYYLESIRNLFNNKDLVEERFLIRFQEYIIKPQTSIGNEQARKILITFSTNLDKNYHGLICQEILEFLKTRSAYPIFEKLVKYSFCKSQEMYSLQKGYDHFPLPHQVLDMLIMNIISVSWLEELKKYYKNILRS